MNIKDLGKGALAMFATGSRVICNPPVLTTDVDYIVLATTKGALVAKLVSNQGWLPSSGDPNYGGDFISLVKGNVNLIITDNPTFYEASHYAHKLAKRLNLLNKQDRIDLFELARYGSFDDLTN